MNQNDTVKLLEDIRHELCFLSGLYAYDGVCPEDPFELNYTKLISRIDEIVSNLPISVTRLDI